MIRPYQLSDNTQVLSLCKEFWEASCVDDLGPFDLEHTREKLEQMIGSGICLVTEDVTGFIIIIESTNLCNPRPIAAEVAWYVTPSARRGAGIKLLKAAFNYCELKKISALSMMFMQSSMPESIVKIYDRMGMTLRETTYIKRFY